ncbi:alpha-galactosidase [Aureobasidium pullulans]|uniref:Alpha-galactosidase n=1 Tax=Aureobasidium pullulans TaxID=5580 RepID=A0A4S9B974_AURPU|nr:alpha-galactosidase [Aureobasidium pullulans]THW25150.1 alpha-galactosidase [Aureobasidium pullulans]THW58256.1 alpha-galactosidase [Aureobasidium pullulans]THW89558.1 alpha-galactosidase [Aureobasidium pullulans]THW99265.1 alpha-galactosidase [Aureobasidium pullulans]
MFSTNRFFGLSFIAGLVASVNGDITASGTNFSLSGADVSYRFHVDPRSGDLISDHFGGPVDDFTDPATISNSGWSTGLDNVGTPGLTNIRREFPDVGRSDFRLPAIHISHADGDTVSAFTYQSHEIVQGKPALPGLPATFGNDGDVTTLVVTLYDNYSDVSAALSYSIFPEYNAIARSFQITNNGTNNISIERAASFSTDLPNLDLKMLELQGDWSHEANRVIRNVDFGETGFRSTEGYSSHVHNPFFVLHDPTTTETTGEAWGFNLVYTGSFAATAERFSHGFVRVLLGLNPLHASIPVGPGQTFQSPEAVAIYSSTGLGGMSRSFHDLYRNHLSRSNHTFETRPILLNSWEGLGFEINETSLENLANETAGLGIKLFVNDDGWFGQTPYARINDTAGLGDWTPNPDHFPNGLAPYTETVDSYAVTNSSSDLAFGIWVEPEMVNPNSTLYHEHPDWVMYAGNHVRTLTRNQLVLNLALPEVQDYLINAISNVIKSANISYIKWDNNRAIHEMSSPAADYAYTLGMYRVMDNLTGSYPEILWEGCASGGGRFDPGILHYYPQSWTSDNTDAADRLTIQLGTSLAYPLSSMACHVSAVPNGLTGRNISIEYRAHVALMCGSFGFELNPSELSADERDAIPSIISTWEQINPIVISGSFYRIAWPSDTNWPAVQFVSKDENTAVVFAFQQFAKIKPAAPPLKMQGLDGKARYSSNAFNGTLSGNTLMNGGVNLPWMVRDYQSMLIWLYKE